MRTRDEKSKVNFHDDIDRDVYCILGLVFDAVKIGDAGDRLRRAAVSGEPYLLSTANVNFLINGGQNAEFRDAVLDSDLCVADGMPLIWIAKLVGIPLPERVAGSDLFEALKKTNDGKHAPLSVFFFGGADGVAEQACSSINRQNGNLTCAGALGPGFASLEDLSKDEIIASINDSGADFLVVALGAVKGHLWLERNKDKLTIPLRSHLGAVINFEAGGVARAPNFVSKTGFEWLWRIKEEPGLWRRYFKDGLSLLWLLITRVFPLVLLNLRLAYLANSQTTGFAINSRTEGNKVVISLSGHVSGKHIAEIQKCFRNAADSGLDIVVETGLLEFMDACAFGTLVMLRKRLLRQNNKLNIVGGSLKTYRLFRKHGLEFLLEGHR